MTEEHASVRYLVDDVEAAVDFYTTHLGFALEMRAGGAFADVRRGPLRLLVSGAASSGARATPPDVAGVPGRNRINLVVDDRGCLHLLDLDGLKFLDVVPDRRAAADLERLARGVNRFPSVQAGDRVAFLRRYCRARARRTVPRLEG